MPFNFFGSIFGLQPILKIIIIIFFILHFHWDIFQECILSYYQKRLLNKNYKLGELEFLTPDFQDDKIKTSVYMRLLTFSFFYFVPLLFAFFLLKNKTKLLVILFSLTTIIHLKYLMKIYCHFNKYNEYAEDII